MEIEMLTGMKITTTNKNFVSATYLDNFHKGHIRKVDFHYTNWKQSVLTHTSNAWPILTWHLWCCYCIPSIKRDEFPNQTLFMAGLCTVSLPIKHCAMEHEPLETSIMSAVLGFGCQNLPSSCRLRCVHRSHKLTIWFLLMVNNKHAHQPELLGGREE